MLKKYISIYIIEIILVIIWIIIALIINPQGNFPLNDDWAYSLSVETLLNEGFYKPENWPAMTLIAQVYWGALFCLIFGFSFTILRVSTLIIGIIGVLFIYKLFKNIGIHKNIAFVGTLMLIINPLYLSLSFTFMTDVPFAAICVIATYFFIEYLRKQNILFLIIATLFSLIALFIRQLGLLLPLTFAITYLLTHQISRKAIIKVLFPIILSALLLLIFNYWLKNTGRMTEYYEKVGGLSSFIEQSKMPFVLYFTDGLWRMGIILKYCAIFLSPLLIIIAPKVIWNMIKDRKLIPIIISGIITIAFFIGYPDKVVLVGNVFYNLGLGPKLLKDTYLIGTNVSPELNTHYLTLISVIGTILLFILLVLLLNSFIELIKNIIKKEICIKVKLLVYSYVLLILYSGFLFISISFFDRYLMISLILILIILIASYGDTLTKERNYIKKIFACMFFLLIAYFSIAATHDYISWNRARWKAINYLLNEKNVSPSLIDGGFEFNGYYKTGQRRATDDKKSWWFVDNDDYVISFGKLINYTSVKTYTFPYLLLGSNNKIEILKRDSISPKIE